MQGLQFEIAKSLFCFFLHYSIQQSDSDSNAKYKVEVPHSLIFGAKFLHHSYEIRYSPQHH